MIRGFVIPDVLAHPRCPWLLRRRLMTAPAMSAWTICASTSLQGKPFNVRGKMLPVQQGPVLILNGDQSMSQGAEDQLQEIDLPKDAPMHVQTNWIWPQVSTASADAGRDQAKA